MVIEQPIADYPQPLFSHYQPRTKNHFPEPSSGRTAGGDMSWSYRAYPQTPPGIANTAHCNYRCRGNSVTDTFSKFLKQPLDT